MRKIITLLLVLVCTFSVVYATEITGASEGSVDLDEDDLASADTNKTASLKVNLALGVDDEGKPDTTGQKVVVGFSNSKEGLTVTNYPTGDALSKSIDLVLDPDTAKATLGTNKLYVFWSVQSSKNVKIDLDVSGPLTRTEGGRTLDWTVSKVDDEETVYCGSATGTTYKSTVYDHEVGDGKPIGKAGAVELAIETVDYSSKVAGNYSAYLYVTVSGGNA